MNLYWATWYQHTSSGNSWLPLDWWRDQGNLKGESVVAAILPSCIMYGGELLYLRIFSYVSLPSNSIKRELPFTRGLTSCTHVGYHAVNHTVTIMCRGQKKTWFPLLNSLDVTKSKKWLKWSWTIDIEYNKRLDRQQPCLEGDFNGGSNNIVQSNKSVWRRW